MTILTKLFISQISPVPRFFLAYSPKCFHMRLNIIFLTFRTATIRIEILFPALFLFPGKVKRLFYVMDIFLLVLKCIEGGVGVELNDKVCAGLRYWYHEWSVQIQLCCVKTVTAVYTDHNGGLRNIHNITNFHTCQILDIYTAWQSIQFSFFLVRKTMCSWLNITGSEKSFSARNQWY